MYRIAICDDDLVFGSLLEQYLQNFAKTRRIPIDVLVFARGEEYLEFLIEEFPVDLIFLDIQFEKGLDGVQIGKELRADIKNEMTQIIYISGIESYAMQLFQNRPMDFLVKPVKQERVDHIMEEYLRLFGNRNKQYFDYNVGKTHYRLLEDEIIYFQCMGRKIQMFTKNEEEVEFYGQINEVKRQISEDKFWHIHHDDVDDILRTVKFTESLMDCKVIALSLFPLDYLNGWKYLRNIKEKIDTVELKNRVKEIEKITSIPTFILGDNMEENKMFEVIIDYFGS